MVLQLGPAAFELQAQDQFLLSSPKMMIIDSDLTIPIDVLCLILTEVGSSSAKAHYHTKEIGFARFMRPITAVSGNCDWYPGP
jgi:hypothetical protein